MIKYIIIGLSLLTILQARDHERRGEREIIVYPPHERHYEERVIIYQQPETKVPIENSEYEIQKCLNFGGFVKGDYNGFFCVLPR